MSKFNLPTHLNGYQVIRSAESSNCVTVMVERKDEPYMPYVVATWWPELETSWHWGHYCSSLGAATETFAAVMLRNDRR